MSPRKKAEIARARAGKPVSEEEAGELIAKRMLAAWVEIVLPESHERCSHCGEPIVNMPLSGATIHVELE